jgi:hypothetical protein
MVNNEISWEEKSGKYENTLLYQKLFMGIIYFFSVCMSIIMC